MTYAGDLTSLEAAKALEGNAAAVIIDVRTDAEWSYVGIPTIENLHLIPWILFPSMQPNHQFVNQVKEAGIAPDQPIYVLCRSGARSAMAASLLTAEGYQTCYNISDGFEGDGNCVNHRGTVNGWKASGLPWKQG